MVRDNAQRERRRSTPSAARGPCAPAGKAMLALVCLVTGCQGGRPTLVESLDRARARSEVRRGERLLAQSKTDQAAAAFGRAVAHYPHCAAAQARLGEISASVGDMDGASDHFGAAVKSEPENMEYALALAEHFRAAAPTSMDPTRTRLAAIRAYRHARSIDPTRLSAAVGLAKCLRSLGAHGAALGTLCDARRWHADSAELHCEIAATHLRLAEEDRALAAYGEALRIDPDCIAAHNGAGEINAKLSGIGVRQALARERAAAHLRRSLELDADQPRIRTLLAGIGGVEQQAAGHTVDGAE